MNSVKRHDFTELCACFARDGYAVLPSVVLQSELEIFRGEAERLRTDKQLMDQRNLRAATRSNLTGEEQIVDRLDPILDLSPKFAALAQDPRILSPVEAVFGEPALLMKDKLIYKFPGAFGYGCHQDYTSWLELPAPPEAMLSVLVALDASNCDNGAIELFPGMHHEYYLERIPPRRLLDPAFGLVPESILAGRKPVMLELQAGDLLVFSSLAPHQSGPNRTDDFRRHVYFTYSAACYGDLYAEHYERLQSYLRADRCEDLAGEQYYR